MADVKTLTVDGTKYDIKDAAARTNISTLTSSVNSLGGRVDALETASANHVTLDTKQEITEQKIFQGSGKIVTESTSINNGVNPSSIQYHTCMLVNDRTGKTVSVISFSKATNGRNTIYLQPVGYDASKSYPVVYGGGLGISCNKDGTNTQATAPTPAASSSDDNIATTKWVKERIAESVGPSNLLASLYPVGSIYIGTQSTCPLATLIPGSTWAKVAGDRVLQTSSSSHSANSTIAAGLPNATGNMGSGFKTTDGSFQQGLFKWVRGGAEGVYGSGKGAYGVGYFDLSWSNPIYGNSTTVQPPAYVVNVWRRTA